MAGAVSLSATLSSFVPKSSLKPLLFSPLSTPVRSKLTKRKNYLRPKILKTIAKPFPSSTPSNPLAPVESPPETKPFNDVVFEPPSDGMPNEVGVLEETSKVEEFQVSETSGVAGETGESFGKISAYSVLKFGFYFAAFFIFQTMVALWVMGSGYCEDKDDGLQRNKRKNGKLLNNGKVGTSSRNVLSLDDSRLEEKVEEIRAMAREARKIEEKEKNGDQEGDMIDESLSSKARIGIEKEIGARLNKLEKKLNSKRKNVPGSYMSFLDKLKDAEDAKEMNEKLFVKKKFQFRGPEKNSRSEVKGFSGSKNGSSRKDNQSGIKTGPWWLKLPYVLAIHMRRGVDADEPGGLFTLGISSEGEEQSETSCTVAFEDHNDANNFCYLLECFFEDLGDFSAEVVPMSVKELYEAIKLHAKKVIVLKKGQLKLYAGQPFAEVEMALHSLIEDNQGALITNSE